METMKAVVKTKPEFGAELQDKPIPKPQPDWLIVKVRATSICGTDVHIYKWDPWSADRIGAKALPQILGHEVAGEVVEVGSSCKRIKVGDYISAETHIYDPGDLTSMLGAFHVGKNMKILGVDYDGCFAEYFALPESICWPNDKSIPSVIASIQEPLGNACYAVLGEDADVAGKSMVITGDGPISLFAIGVARVCGVAKIIHLGKYDFNMEIARKMGADLQLYTNQTTAQERLEFVMDHTGGDGVDIALEMVGSQDSINDCFAMVRKAGRLTAFGIAPESPVPVDYNNGIVFKGCQIHGINGRKIFDTWYRNRNLLASCRLDPTPVITNIFPLSEFATGFEKMLERPRKSAKVVLFPDKAEYEAAAKFMKE
ncbi:MAG: alcohol dehydrogenase catalytic domain-containing protein [Phycisphaerales bacterium]|nr:MAG: alcohol dehydrogenase catalytic domain-containing protein [Phycisphaerales bacterium]